MSCIAALINTDGTPVDQGVLRRLMHVAPYDRPSETRIWADGCVGLGYVPLRTGPSDTGTQPRSLDGRLWAVMDGRLDARGGLVAALAERHETFDATQASDLDLVLRAYDAWGPDCVSRLLGDFAIYVWDAQRRHVWCARDHFGVKPLYYARVGHVLVLSNVLRAVQRHPAVTDRLRDEAIGDFLLFGLSMEPSQTMFADVSRLPPAHRLTCPLAPESLRVDRYWSLESRDLIRYADPRDYVEEFNELFRVAVADRLRSDRIGVLMSGGLDSSSIATVAAGILGPVSASDRLRAFTVVYEALMKDEERFHSAVVAGALGIGISHMEADTYEPFERWGSDALPPEPSLEALTAVMSDLLELASLHGDAALTGEGGDPMLLPSTVIELLGRMPVTRLVSDLWASRRARAVPPFGMRSTIRRWLGDTESVPNWLTGELIDAFDPRDRAQEIRRRRLAHRGARSAALNDVTDPWWTSTFEGLDPGATRRAVELRYPFFDVRLSSFLLRLPSFPWCLNKRIVRSAMHGKLPESIRLRPKTPLTGDPAGPRGRWSVPQAVSLFESTPEVASFIDIEKFRCTVQGDSLLTDKSPGTWAAIGLAMWLRCARTSADMRVRM